MITGIREKAIVKEGGRIEISSAELPIGMEVEVIVLVDEAEGQDATEYLLLSDANRKYLEDALEELKHPEKFVRVDVENL